MSGEERKFNEDSIVEYMTIKLKKIQKEKTMTNEQMGQEFAQLLTKEYLNKEEHILLIKSMIKKHSSRSSSSSSESSSSEYE